MNSLYLCKQPGYALSSPLATPLSWRADRTTAFIYAVCSGSFSRLLLGPAAGTTGRRAARRDLSVTYLSWRKTSTEAGRIDSGISQAPRTRRLRSKQKAKVACTSLPPSAILLIGFPFEEVAAARKAGLMELLGFPDAMVLSVTRAAMACDVASVLHQSAAAVDTALAAGSYDDEDGAMEGGRIAYCIGECQQAAGMINEVLVGLGIAPAIVAAAQPRHDGLRLSDIAHLLRKAHAEYYELVQPVKVLKDPPGLEDIRLVLNVQLDAGKVPSMLGGYRADTSGLVVLDGLCSELERGAILDWLTQPGHDHTGSPPAERWEQACVDRSGDQATWGLKQKMIAALSEDPPPAIVMVQSRLAALYPEYTLAHMPAAHMPAPSLPRGRDRQASAEPRQAGGASDDEELSDLQLQEEEEEANEQPLSAFVGNAVVPGDPCAWHLDADPSSLPPSSAWVHNYGYYTNREPGRPLFVSLLLYLNDAWPDDYHAETLFLDPETQAGVFVRPAPGRVVLMEQDIAHRISAPSQHASGPRYSIVWKAVLFPRGAPTTTVAADREGPTGDVHVTSDLPAGVPVGHQAPATTCTGPGCKEGQAEAQVVACNSLQNDPSSTSEGQQHGGSSSCNCSRHVGVEGCETGGLQQRLETICRPEWGKPMQFGSARRSVFMPAWRK